MQAPIATPLVDGLHMVRRWVAVGILEAQRGFRRLRGCHGISLLIKALRDAEQIDRIDAEENVA